MTRYCCTLQPNRLLTGLYTVHFAALAALDCCLMLCGVDKQVGYNV